MRISAITTATVLLMAALTGCTSSGTGGAMGPLASPSAAVTSAPPSRLPSRPPSSSPPAANFPTTPQGYADATMSAWTSHKDARLSDLTTDDVGASIATLPAGIDAHWHYHGCDGAAGSTSCTYDNNNGDRVELRVDNATVGQPDAVIEFKYDPTVYATGADAYVNAFMQAWKDGNTRRMEDLSSTEVTRHFAYYTPPDTWTLSDDSDAAHTHVTITSDPGFVQLVEVVTLSLGQPHAIAVVCDLVCP